MALDSRGHFEVAAELVDALAISARSATIPSGVPASEQWPIQTVSAPRPSDRQRVE
ncbi:MAG TPA: hypothetical protein VKD69_09375 [Vicinamibacterales bacterium]|nr:hypothetical protein [Vicinamibacterales bacterium]